MMDSIRLAMEVVGWGTTLAWGGILLYVGYILVDDWAERQRNEYRKWTLER